MKHFRRVILCTLTAALLVGCEKEGPAEKAGHEVDEAVDEAKDELEDAKEEIDEELNDD